MLFIFPIWIGMGVIKYYEMSYGLRISGDLLVSIGILVATCAGIYLTLVFVELDKYRKK